MKKYIRTKYGIFKSNEYKLSIEELQGIKHGSTYSKDLKIADTIEELCDEFVIHNPNNDGDWFPKYFVYKNRIEDLFTESMIKLQKEKNIEVFASIWLEDGTLKSVAKMKGILSNGKIDWELL